MGAGLSTKEFNRIIYRHLKRIQNDLLKAGVPVKYEKYQLFPDMTGDNRDLSFNISYRRINASNGECAGLPSIRVQLGSGKIETFDHLSFNKGIERIKQVFKKPVDFYVRNEGTIFLLAPNTPAAYAWIEEHIPEDAQYFGASVVVEHRYISDIVEGIKSDGLTVE